MATDLPEYFKCPISLEIMTDPVILSSGHTFDRPSIQRWLDSGHRTCPITKLPLPDPTPLIPNHALRSLISNYTPRLPPSPPPQKPQNALALSLSTLTSPKSPLSSKLLSLSSLISLSQSDPTARKRLSEPGAISSSLLRCLDSDHFALKEKSLTLLLNLSLDDDNKVGLVAEGAVGKLVNSLSLPPPVSALSATLLTSLAMVEVNKATIGAHPGAVRSLVTLLSSGTPRERKEAATALFVICSFPENRRRAVDCGAVGLLLGMAAGGMERAVEALGVIAKCREGREEMAARPGAVRVLVDFVKGGGGSGRGVQYGLMALNSMCSASGRVRGEVLREGVLDLCLALVEGDGSEKVRRAASCLIETLRAE